MAILKVKIFGKLLPCTLKSFLPYQRQRYDAYDDISVDWYHTIIVCHWHSVVYDTMYAKYWCETHLIMRTGDVLNMSRKCFYINMILRDAISTHMPIHEYLYLIGLVALEKSEHTQGYVYTFDDICIIFIFRWFARVRMVYQKIT